MNRVLIFLSFLFVINIIVPVPLYAADCAVVYGGGKTDCVKGLTVTPTLTPIPTTPPPATQSKGGLPIQQAPVTTTAPSTGPESLSLFYLLPAAAAGIWLRRKTK